MQIVGGQRWANADKQDDDVMQDDQLRCLICLWTRLILCIKIEEAYGFMLGELKNEGKTCNTSYVWGNGSC